MVAVPSRGRADLQAPAPEAVATQDLYERHGRQIYFFCLSRLRSPEEAEDATQSTFLNAFRGLQRGIAPEHETAWLYKIAENVCLTRARSSVRRRRVETPGDLDAVADVTPAPEPDTDEIHNLPEALQAMPEQQRRALLLREWQGLSYREIADELELSQSAVETLLFRARRTLAAGLTEEPKRGRVSRLRAGGDPGWFAALLKTFVFSGGAKVALVGAVAASSVVGVSPGFRHELEDTLVPHMKTPAPVVHHAAAGKAPVTASVAIAPARAFTTPARVAGPVVHKAKKAKHAVVPAAARHDHGRHLGRPVPVETPQPAAPAQPPVDAAPVASPTLEPTPQGAPTQSGQGDTKGKSASGGSSSANGNNGNGNGAKSDGHGQSDGHAQPQPSQDQQAPPAAVAPDPSATPTPTPSDGQPASGQSASDGHGQDGRSSGSSGSSSSGQGHGKS